MPTPHFDDLAAFISDFAVTITVELAGGATRDFLGIYDGPYLNAQLGEYDLDTIQPRITCMMADVSTLKRGDVVRVPEAGTFDVLTGAQPDGTGMAVLKLAPPAVSVGSQW